VKTLQHHRKWHTSKQPEIVSERQQSQQTTHKYTNQTNARILHKVRIKMPVILKLHVCNIFSIYKWLSNWNCSW
jgi:hypothetical protein